MNPEIEILLIEDDEDDFLILRDMIRAIPGGQYRLDWASNFPDALNMSAAKSFAVYLVDYRLGKYT